jgi:hypothetical protein
MKAFQANGNGSIHYAVFSHHEHVSMLRRTHYTIWNKWLPGSAMEIADAPSFERYSEQFNPMTGTGLIEVLDAGKRSHEGDMIWVDEAWTMNFEVR